MTAEIKPCGKCGGNDFGSRRNRKGYCRYCKECHRARSKRWRNENPDLAREKNKKWARRNPKRVREYAIKWKKENPKSTRNSARKGQLKYNYGLTQEEYNSMLENQGQKCAACKGFTSQKV